MTGIEKAINREDIKSQPPTPNDMATKATRCKERLTAAVQALNNEREILLLYAFAKALTNKEVPHRAAE